jgi:CubicO group peptidase (beta-lactamase class C family)
MTESAGAPVNERIEAVLREVFAKGGPGGAVGVAHRGRTVHLRGYGLANVEHGIPFTPTTPTRLGSVTKHFVAAAIALLAQRGLVSLDDFASRYLGWLPAYARNLRIRDFLNNTSGLRDDEALMSLSGIPDDAPCSETYLARLAVAQRAPNFAAGAHCLYTNTPFRFLARLIEGVTGRSFGEFMRSDLFEPLGMHASQMTETHREYVAALSSPYQIDSDGTLLCVQQGTAYSGDGAMISTATDLLTWNENLRENRLAIAGFPYLLLQRPSFANPDPERYYGLGTMVQPIFGELAFCHAGAMGGHRAEIVRLPERDLFVAVVVNRDDLEPTQISRSCVAGLLGRAGSRGRAPAPASVPPKGLARFYAHAESGYVLETSAVRGRFVINLMSDRQQLRRLADGRYVPAFGYSSYVLTLVPGQTPPSLTLELGREAPLTFIPVKPALVPADLQHDYIGTYYSAELDAFWHLRSGDDGCMTLQRDRGYTPEQVYDVEGVLPDVACAFYRGTRKILRFQFMAMRFTRDCSGAVTGLVASLGRARDVVFAKTSPEPGGLPQPPDA